MNETRYDWLTDRWVIFAPSREERPDQFRLGARAAPSGAIDCPFCAGFEHETPNPTLVLPEFDSDATTHNRKQPHSYSAPRPWIVRVVPNKYPAVPRFFDPESLPQDLQANSCSEACADFGSHSSGSHSSGSHGPNSHSSKASTRPSPRTSTATLKSSPIFRKRNPRGGHEVIIESPSHVDSITALSVEHIEMVMEAYRRRLVYWRAQSDMMYAVVFKNFGSDAGASLFHSHSQLISLDFVPRDIERIQERLAQYLREFGRCYLCEMVEEEIQREERVLLATEHFVAICPFASRLPFSFTILPRKHRAAFEDITAEELHDLASVTRRTLRALEAEKPSASYNLVLQTSPFQSHQTEASHWRLRVIPRLSKVAGFEWGSDCFINTVTPELAAAVLREHLH